LRNTPLGGNGGGGNVVIKYSDTYPELESIGVGLVYTLSNSGGYRTYTFQSGSDSVTI